MEAWEARPTSSRVWAASSSGRKRDRRRGGPKAFRCAIGVSGAGTRNGLELHATRAHRGVPTSRWAQYLAGPPSGGTGRGAVR